MSNIIYPIFNPLNFSQPTVLNNAIISNLQTSNISSASIQINSGSGSTNVATETYVNNAVSTLENTLLGTNIPSQLNQNLNTILEIDNFITDLNNTVNTKANQTDLNTTNANVLTNTNNITTNTNAITSLQTTKANQTDLNTTNSNVLTNTNNITTNTNAITALQSRLTTDETNITSNTSNITSNTNAITALQSRLTTDETNIITNTSNITSNTNAITSLQTSKADKSLVLYSNSWYVNSGQNLISSVLTSIGNSQNQTIYLSSGGINEASGLNIVDKVNLTIVAPECGFSSPATIVYGNISVSGSSNLRLRVSNVGFQNNFTIDGTQGKHSFKGCVFSQNFSLLNATTNWVFFYYCTFSGQVNIPSTYAGYIEFYFCDFSGATLNFNNLSNQQIYINSCINLPTLSLNALLNGFNTTASSSAINTVSLNCSGSVVLPSNSIPISSINNLQSSLDAKQNLLLFDSTPTTSSTNIVNSGNIKTYVDTSISNLVASAPSTLDTLNELAQALNNDANFSTTITNLIGTKANQTDLNTTNTNVTANTTNITSLQSSKQNNLSYDTVPTASSTNSLTSGSIYTALQNYVLSSSLASTLASYVTSSSLSSTLSSYLTISSASSTYQSISSMSSYLTSSSATSTYQTISGMSSYLTTSTASATYQTLSGMSNYASLSGNNSLSGSNTITVSELYEQVYNAGSGTNLSLTYTSIKGIIYYSPSANFTLTLSSVPTVSTNASYSITLIYNTKFYCNAISVNGTSYTLKAGGGLANITINTSATQVFQQINILFLNSSTPIATTNVISLF